MINKYKNIDFFQLQKLKKKDYYCWRLLKKRKNPLKLKRLKVFLNDIIYLPADLAGKF